MSFQRALYPAQWSARAQAAKEAADWRRGDVRSAVEHLQAAVRIGVALRDRWLLARLLGTTDTLAQATGATPGEWAHLPGEQDVAGLRERIAREGELAAA